MWILDFLPDAFVHFLVLAGIAGTIASFFLGMIPFIGTYKLPIQIISLVLLSLGVYLEGGLSNQEQWRIKVAELETKLAKQRENAAKINTQIVTNTITKKQVIKEKGETIIQFIDREVVKYDKSCPIPLSVITSHDAAAKNMPELVNPVVHDAATKPALRLPTK
jgi:hypothetical protein